MGAGLRGGLPGWENLQKLDKALTVDTAKERVASALKDWGYAELVVDTVASTTGRVLRRGEGQGVGQARARAFVDADVRHRFRRRGVAGWNTKYGQGPDLAAAVGEDHHGRRGEEARPAVARPQPRPPEVRAEGRRAARVLLGPAAGRAGSSRASWPSNAYTSQVWYRGGRGGRFAVAAGSDARLTASLGRSSNMPAQFDGLVQFTRGLRLRDARGRVRVLVHGWGFPIGFVVAALIFAGLVAAVIVLSVRLARRGRRAERVDRDRQGAVRARARFRRTSSRS